MRQSSHPWIVTGMASLLAALSLAACQNKTISENKEASESGSQTIPVTGGQPISLEVTSGVGDVTIRAGQSGDQILIQYTKIAYGKTDAEARSELAAMTLSIEQSGHGAVINSVQTANTHHPRMNQVNLDITVPAEISLKVTQRVGSVQIDGVRVPDPLAVTNSVGDLALNDVQALDGMTLHVDTGNITFSGVLSDQGSYALTVSTGSITIRLPKDSSAGVDAAVTTGEISLTGLTLSGQSQQKSVVGMKLSGVLGSGGPTLHLSAAVGNIQIKAR
jgi:hypothetical protein